MNNLGNLLSKSSYFGDARLSTRFGLIVNQLLHNTGKSIPQSCCNVHQSKAVYRFMDNEKVSYDHIQDAEQERLMKMMLPCPPKILLHVQDTTTLNFSKQKSSDNLPCLNYAYHKGLFLHTGLLMSSLGDIYGILSQEFYGRQAENLGIRRSRDSFTSTLSIETKESYRWVKSFQNFASFINQLSDTQGISICDREGDFFELYHQQAIQGKDKVDLIIRSQHNRTVYQDGKVAGKINDVLASLPSQGRCFINPLKENDKHDTRIAELEIRFTKVELALPDYLRWNNKAGLKPQKKKNTLYLVEAKEKNPPLDITPIHWILITTLPVEDLSYALEIIRYYGLRWNIEIFHLVLKEGFAIEKLQLLTEHRLTNAIATYSIVAAQVTHFRLILKEKPTADITILGYNKLHYILITNYLNYNHSFKLTVVEQPTVRDFLETVALLASGKKSKEIGVRALWIGLSKADIIFKTAFSINAS
jgi:hypothetical protein